MQNGTAAEDPFRVELDKILGSESFRNAEGLRRLLAYLGEKSLVHKADELKEYTIGVEACGKPATYDPQKDAAVRVQVGRLRQKLADYYQNEGRGDPFVLDIPKGQFALVSHRRVDGSPGPSPETAVGPAEAQLADPRQRSSWRRFALPATALLLAGFVLWTALLSRKVAGLEERLATPFRDSGALTALCRPFFSRGAQNVIVFGSPAFFVADKYKLFLRLYDFADPNDPHSSPEFRNLNTLLGGLQGPRYDYASMGDAVAAQRLTAAFGSAGVSLRAVPAHLAVWDSLQDANLIFLGAARMNALLRRLPVRQDFEIGADSFIHNRYPQRGEQEVYSTPSHRDAISYAVIGVCAGLKPEHETLLLTAHSTPGTMGAVDFLTSSAGAAAIRDRLKLRPGERKHFQILIRVYSDNDVPVKTEYVTHHLTP